MNLKNKGGNVTTFECGRSIKATQDCRIKLAVTLCLAVFAVLSASCAKASAYQDYQAISQVLEKAPVGQQDAVKRFVLRYGKGTLQERTMAFYLQLRLSLKLEDFQGALDAAEALLRLQPTADQKKGLHKLCAQLSYRMNAFDKAVDYVVQWEKEASQDEKKGESYAQLLSLVAYSKWQSDEVKASVPWMRRAFKESPTKDRGNFLLSAWQTLQDEKAELQFLPVMIRNWGDSLYWARLGALRYERGEFQSAYQILSSAEKSGKLSNQMLPMLLDLSLKEECAGKTLVLLKKYRTEIPVETAAALHLNAALKLGLTQEALGRVSELEAKRKDKNASRSLCLRRTQARLAFAEENWRLAKSSMLALAADETDPKAADSWRILAGIAAFELADYDEAKQVWERVKEADLRSTAEVWIKQAEFMSDS